MKIIFLDFDGVITIPPKWELDDKLIRNVLRIVNETGAKIVISSSWRSDNIENTINNVIIPRITINETTKAFIDNLYDVTPWVGLGNGRGGEIQKWLNEHNDIDNYVIIDDDHDMLDFQLYHFVQTNFEDGLTEVETNRAIKILNRKFIRNTMALNFTLRYEWLKRCEGLPNNYDKLTKYNDCIKYEDTRL